MLTSPWFVRIVRWSGALAFVGSLAYGGYAYVVRFAEAAAPQAAMAGPAVTNVLLFSLFALHHSVLARTGAKDAVVKALGADLERPLYVWLSSVLFVICCRCWQPLPGTAWAFPPAWAPAGLAVQGVGVLITAVAARRLDVFVLAGLKAPRPSTLQPLETTGLYGWVRHPIYFGWVLLVLGTPVMTWTRAAFAFTSIAYLAIAVPFEERGLVAVYGDVYRDYQRRVRARLLPGVY